MSVSCPVSQWGWKSGSNLSITSPAACLYLSGRNSRELLPSPAAVYPIPELISAWGSGYILCLSDMHTFYRLPLTSGSLSFPPMCLHAKYILFYFKACLRIKEKAKTQSKSSNFSKNICFCISLSLLYFEICVVYKDFMFLQKMSWWTWFYTWIKHNFYWG